VDRTWHLPFWPPPWRKAHSKYGLLPLLRYFLCGWLTVQSFQGFPFVFYLTQSDEIPHVIRDTYKYIHSTLKWISRKHRHWKERGTKGRKLESVYYTKFLVIRRRLQKFPKGILAAGWHTCLD
jgi:hypothetical protein